MYVRLAFAIAAHLEPEILIVDEVLAVGDAQFQKKCLGKMEDVSKVGGRTVLFVSHNMGTILQLCNTSILLNQGQIEQIGKTSSIVEAYYQSNSSKTLFKVNDKSEVFIKNIFTCDENCNPKEYFGHHDSINLQLTIGFNKNSPVYNIGLCLLKQDKKRVFTVNKSISDFFEGKKEEMTLNFRIDGGLIAPSDYSFLFALNTKNGSITYDLHEDICPIKVYDDGTEFSFAEGFDYGCIIIKETWNKIN